MSPEHPTPPAPASTPPDGSTVTLTELQHALKQLFAPWVQQLHLSVTAAGHGDVELTLPITPAQLQAAGVLCGQTLMAAADTAMVLAIMTRLGGFRPMTTVQLQTSFLRAVPGPQGQVRLVARVLRMGRQLVFGEVQAFGPDGQLAAHSTTTYALL